MREDDRKPFVELLTAAMDVYGKDMSKSLMYVWWSALERFDYAAVRGAFSAWMQNPDSGQFAPKPADIIRMIEGTTGDKAMLAWSKVDKAVRILGHYQSVAFDDPIIHCVIDDMGGWISLASTPTDKDLEFRGKEFVTRYRAYALRGVDEYPAYLVGESESTNGRNGFIGYDDLKLVGPPDAVKAVIEKGGSCKRLAISTMPSAHALLSGTISRIEQSRPGITHEPDIGNDE